MRLSLRIYLALLGVLLAMGAASAGIAYFTDHRPYRWARQQGLRQVTHLAHNLAPDLDAPVALQRRCQQIGADLQVDLTVLDAAGRPLCASGEPIATPEPETLTELSREPQWLGGRFLMGGPIRLSGAPPSVLLVRPHGPEEHFAFPWRPLATLSILLVLGFVVVSPLSRSITRPLETLAATADRFGAGDFEARSGISGADEVGRLARSFDAMAARIQAARKAEKELLANVSHELRTPLTRIRLALELVEPPDDAVRARIASVSDDVNELERLVADVLTASRLELAQLPLTKAPVRLADLAHKSRRRALDLFPGRAIDVDVPEALTVTADASLLSRALDNLVDNACKYSDADQPVRIEGGSAGGTVSVAVVDQGAGIEEADLARIFDPFFRTPSARGRAAGFGLGLALARRIAEAHGGTIAATSRAGQGTRFEVALPA